MNTASDNRYEVIASFSVSGEVPISAAIAGSEVAITVASMFSMNSAAATISGIRRSLFIRGLGQEGSGGRESRCNILSRQRPLHKPQRRPKSCVMTPELRR